MDFDLVGDMADVETIAAGRAEFATEHVFAACMAKATGGR
jgi:hypothetical protein